MYGGPAKENKQRKLAKYVITEGIRLVGSKKSTLYQKVRYNRVRNNRSIFIRLCMDFVPGPTTLVRYIRKYVITEYVVKGLYCITLFFFY